MHKLILFFKHLLCTKSKLTGKRKATVTEKAIYARPMVDETGEYVYPENESVGSSEKAER